MHHPVKRIGQVLIGVGLIYGLLCGLFYTQQRRIIFRPTRELASTPANLDIPFEEVWIPVEQNQKIHGWWLPTPSARGTLLYLHGNGLNISANLGLAERYRALGLSVLMIDYRGYGLSDGDFASESQTYADADAALQYLLNQRSIPPSEIILFGHSLGGAIAINLAQQSPNVAGLIVQSSFSSMEDLAHTQFWPKLLPLKLLLNQRFQSNQKVEQLAMPKLWMHGSADSLIPPSMSQELHRKSPEPSQIEIVKGAGHNNLATVAGDRYEQLLNSFIELALGT